MYGHTGFSIVVQGVCILRTYIPLHYPTRGYLGVHRPTSREAAHLVAHVGIARVVPTYMHLHVGIARTMPSALSSEIPHRNVD